MPLLYQLNDDPRLATEEIREHYGQPHFRGDERIRRDRLLDDVEKLLTEDGYVAAEVSARIAAVHEGLAAADTELRGPLGLYLALNAAVGVALTSGPTEGLFEQAKRMLADAATQACFQAFYGLRSAYDLSDSELHRVGTTSLILRCKFRHQPEPAKPEDIALKCLLPRYHRVRAILESTAAYEEDHSVDLPSVPHVYESTLLTVAMDFVAGDTLKDRFEQRAVPDDDESLSSEDRARERGLNEQDIAFIREVGLAICARLEELAELGHHHLDLSPSNIILVSDHGEPVRISLIDFGHNFAITERVGSSAAFRRAALYVAPELVEDPSIDSWRCDVYSLGVILLEAGAKRQIQKEDLVGELDRLWQGERPWDGAPGLARVIEELVDQNPALRLALMDEPADRENPYGYLRKLILQETEVLELYERRTTANGFGVLRGVGLLKLFRNTQLLNLFDAAKAVEEPVDDAYKDFPALAKWAVVAMGCWALALAAFVTLTLADLGWVQVAPGVEQLADMTNAKFDVGDFWANLPGRLVALTFSLTAVTYYVNNFSTLSPKRLRVRIGTASEVAMRATAIGLMFPIMWAMLYDPQAWPLCAGIGTMLVVLNNFLALRIAIQAHGAGSRFSTRSAMGDRFITDVFKEWWLLMGAYSLSMVAIGILLIHGIAHDATIFAVLVVFINVAKMYRLNCVETAPQVRGCLSRDILTLRRIDQLRARSTQVTGSFGAIVPGRLAWLTHWLWQPTRAAEATDSAG
jgi:serine/threonine protein kinase